MFGNGYFGLEKEYKEEDMELSLIKYINSVLDAHNIGVKKNENTESCT